MNYENEMQNKLQELCKSIHQIPNQPIQGKHL